MNPIQNDGKKTCICEEGKEIILLRFSLQTAAVKTQQSIMGRNLREDLIPSIKNNPYVYNDGSL